jgi:hypothetical protein
VLNLLVVSTWWPYPPDNGSRVRVFNLLRELSKRYRITLVAFGEPGVPEDAEPLRECCDKVEAIRRQRSREGASGPRACRGARHYVQTEAPRCATGPPHRLPRCRSPSDRRSAASSAIRTFTRVREVEVTMPCARSTPPHVELHDCAMG